MAGTTLHSDGILFLSLELSKSKWVLTSSDGGVGSRRIVIDAADWDRFQRELLAAKKKFKLAEKSPVVSCYEIGRDGFWIARKLTSLGITIHVVDSASIEVNRRRRRVKTDRVDGEALLRMLIRYERGEKKMWSVVHPPNENAEDARRPTRELQRLKKERTGHRNRIGSLLALEGLSLPPGAGFEDELDSLRRWDGNTVGENLKRELCREVTRLRLVEQQIKQLKTAQKQKLKLKTAQRGEKDAYIQHVKALMRLRGLGESSWVLVVEFFGWRKFSNGKEVGSLSGLTGTPYSSGGNSRDQGISKAGNPRVRALMVELAWCWIRYQPHSKLTKWYEEKYGGGTSRSRRSGIVAVARKLLVELWRYLEYGQVPEGAEFRTNEETEAA
jgi:transposase